MLTLAYFDPGSASLLMQALVGGGAGLIVFARYLWTNFVTRGFHATVPSSLPVDRALDETAMVDALSGEFRFHAS
ncbi:MAG: hypothetical protein Q8K78_02150 [Planctomycetaceae bacterium]|nr:hypothetical protein [Planctomycetaceae bacterium]